MQSFVMLIMVAAFVFASCESLKLLLDYRERTKKQYFGEKVHSAQVHIYQTHRESLQCLLPSRTYQNKLPKRSKNRPQRAKNAVYVQKN